MSTHTGHITQPVVAEESDNIFKFVQVKKDDRLWETYVQEATAHDERTLKDWNSIVDVILVYVRIFCYFHDISSIKARLRYSSPS